MPGSWPPALWTLQPFHKCYELPACNEQEAKCDLEATYTQYRNHDTKPVLTPLLSWAYQSLSILSPTDDTCLEEESTVLARMEDYVIDDTFSGAASGHGTVHTSMA